MTVIIKQRIIGAAILLFVLAVIAILLISHADKEMGPTIVVSEPSSVFSDSKLDDIGGVEVLQFQQEAEVEPVYEDLEQKKEPLAAPEVLIEEANTKSSVGSEPSIIKPEVIPVIDKVETNPVVPKSELPTKAVSEQKTVEQSKTKMVAKATGKGWIIQLASFGQKNNAEQLRDKAKKLGYNVKIETGRKGDQQIYRVRIGPEYERSNVDKLVAELTSALKVSPQVLLYKP